MWFLWRHILQVDDIDFAFSTRFASSYEASRRKRVSHDTPDQGFHAVACVVCTFGSRPRCRLTRDRFRTRGERFVLPEHELGESLSLGASKGQNCEDTLTMVPSATPVQSIYATPIPCPAVVSSINRCSKPSLLSLPRRPLPCHPFASAESITHGGPLPLCLVPTHARYTFCSCSSCGQRVRLTMQVLYMAAARNAAGAPPWAQPIY